jgi:hypothetical protein
MITLFGVIFFLFTIVERLASFNLFTNNIGRGEECLNKLGNSLFEHSWITGLLFYSIGKNNSWEDE